MRRGISTRRLVNLDLPTKHRELIRCSLVIALRNEFLATLQLSRVYLQRLADINLDKLNFL